MPSDQTGIEPKGVLTRPAPDWFDDWMATGFTLYTDPTSTKFTYVASSLFNNATDGSVLKVYGLITGDDNSRTQQIYYLRGTFGTVFGPCFSTRMDYPNPFGQMFMQTAIVATATTPSPFVLPPQVTAAGAAEFFSFDHFVEFPLAIIPAGYSLVVVNPLPAFGAGLTVWYQICHE